MQISHLQGDYNFDNSVDAGDYMIWRKHLLNRWQWRRGSQ